MTITKSDLQLIKAADMTDNDTGGGLPSNQMIENGKSNEVFDDVTSLQKASGGVSLRKIFAGVMTDTDEKLLASYFVISQLPTNPNVSLFMFAVDDWASTRQQAENKLTSYLYFGSRWSGHLLETHLKSQATVQLSLDKKDDVPIIGDSLVLMQNFGQSDQFFQFVHILKVTTKTRTFQLNASTSVERVIATLELGEPLRYEFNGLSVAEFYANTSTQRRAVIHSTIVAKANKFYAASKLKQDITANTSNQVLLNTIFTQVVPSSQKEEPLPRTNPAMQHQTLVKAKDGTIAINQSINVSAGQTWFLGSAIYPSSLVLNINGTAITDVNSTLVDSNNKQWAIVDYDVGRITWAAGISIGQRTVTGSFTPAGSLNQFGNTDAIKVPKIGAGKVYVGTLQAPPAPLSVTLGYQFNGRVYVLKDDGKGNLYSPSGGGGVGTVDYATGDYNVTTGVIPDAESLIIISYGVGVNTYHYVNSPPHKAKILIPIPDKTLVNETLVLTWGNKTVTTDASGNLSGAGSGTVAGGLIELTPTDLPAKNTDISVNYSKGATKTANLTERATDGEVVLTLAGTGSLTANSITVNFELIGSNRRIAVSAKDDGVGKMVIAKHDRSFGTQSYVGQHCGTVDYANRKITLSASIVNTTTVNNYHLMPQGAA